MIAPEGTLARISGRCQELIDAADYALSNALPDTGQADSPEARTILTGAAKAAKLLLSHLDEKFEFQYGYLVEKESKEQPSCG